ncbi:MAG: phosphatase PAP2 family protein [Gammaproteobacteria bacterium]
MIAPVLYAVPGLLLGGICLAMQGPLPGDVALTRLLQDIFGTTPAWAEMLTTTAKMPGLWATLVVASILDGLRSGWRGALAPPLALALAYVVDGVARLLMFAPRPAAELVAVAAPSASSGLPSTFGLVYGALFGAVLCVRPRGRTALGLAAAMSVLLLAGASARMVLGGHWGSQVAASLLLGVALAGAAQILVERWCGHPTSC